MKGWKKGLLSAALCAALALALVIPGSGAPGTVYLMAVNDRVLDTTAENMPTVMGGVLYVPYTMLSNRDVGINLGVSAMYSPTRRTVLVYNGQTGVQFDLQTNTAQDLDGNPVAVRAMMRNSMVFLPIVWLCTYFGTISCSRIQTPYGTLIRLTNASVVLDDQAFVNAAGEQLADNLRRYLEAQEPAVSSGPAASETPEPSSAPSRTQLYLAFRSGPQAEETARLLEGRGERALFLFTCGELRSQDDLVRGLVGAGHTVGLALTGEEPGACAAQLEEGRLLLASIARYAALIVSADGLDQEGQALLAREGCVVWTAGFRGEDYPSGTALVEAMDPQRINCVEISCGGEDSSYFRGVLSAMDGESCRVYQATAPALLALQGR